MIIEAVIIIIIIINFVVIVVDICIDIIIIIILLLIWLLTSFFSFIHIFLINHACMFRILARTLYRFITLYGSEHIVNHVTHDWLETSVHVPNCGDLISLSRWAYRFQN